MNIWWSIGVTVAAMGILLCILIAAVRSERPLRQIVHSGFWGLCSLILVHLFGALSGVGLGIGWFTSGAACLLGMPGVILLLLLNVILV